MVLRDKINRNMAIKLSEPAMILLPRRKQLKHIPNSKRPHLNPFKSVKSFYFTSRYSKL
jgi:hypothetical protein